MAYPLHQPISITGGGKLGEPCKRDGVFVDVERDRADIPIVDERVNYDKATQVATDSEVAEPWPFNAATTKWKLKRSIRQKTTQELAAEQASRDDMRIANLNSGDLLKILVAIVNEERTNRSPPVAAITDAQFVAYCRNKLGIGA